MLRVGCRRRGSDTDALAVSALRARASPVALAGDSAGFGMASGLFRGPITPKIDEAEFADLYLITIPQQAFIDEVAVDISAVQAPDIPDHSALRGTAEGGMPAGHRDVIEKDVGILMSSDCHYIGIQEESAASVRATLNDQ
jgi:hypothetical protein